MLTSITIYRFLSASMLRVSCKQDIFVAYNTTLKHYLIMAMSIQISEQIESAIRSHISSISLTKSDISDIQDVRNAIRNIMRDNPDIFWFDHQYRFDESAACIEFRYIFSAKRVEEIKQDIKDVVDNDFCIDYVKTLKVQEQIAYVYKWLVNYCNYNTNSAYNQSIYSVFIRRNSVCTGYAKAAQYLFGLLGVKSRLIFGRLNKDREDGRHCWNIVKCDNRHYHFDASLGEGTLDGILATAGIHGLLRIECVNYAFLCKSDNDILKTRSIEEFESLPHCPESWTENLVYELSGIKIRQRDNIKGARLSYAGSTANVYLCTNDKNTVIKEFYSDCTDIAFDEFRYMKMLEGSRYTLHYNEEYTDINRGLIAIEQSTPILDLFSSYYYELSVKEMVKMATDIAKAWLECKERGIIYRDIHICNIYRSDDGIYKLGDFGSCTDTEERKVIGNQWFMAPETFKWGIFNEQTAIYSIGMLMYFILNNLRPAFWHTPEDADYAVRERISGVKLPLPALLHYTQDHQTLYRIIEKATEANPMRRYHNIKILLNDLQSFDGNWTIIRKGISLEMDLNAGNDDRIKNSKKYFLRDSFHAYAMGEHYGITDEDSLHSYSTQAHPTRFNKGSYSDETFLEEDLQDTKCDSLPTDEIEIFACTAASFIEDNSVLGSFDNTETFSPIVADEAALQKPNITFAPQIELSLWERLFGKAKHRVYSSVFAPAEVRKGKYLLSQFYFHLPKEQEFVNEQALAADKNAERRSYMPLSLKLKKGDTIAVDFNIYGKTLLMSKRTKVLWQGECTKCFFEYLVPDNVDGSELSCVAYISANGAMVGEVRFHTDIVDKPRNTHTDIVSHRYNRIFISYSHKDAQQIKSLALAYKMQGVEYFYDRDNLRSGDLWEEKVLEYIDTADLFILCWSTNAAKSNNVAKERARALIHAYPNIDINEATLKICPISIKPVANLPKDMEKYAYEEL